MIINRICNMFNFLDTAYSDLYEKQIEFEKDPCKRTQENLLESLARFKAKTREYNYSIKSAYFKN